MADATFKVPNNSTVQLQDSTKLPLTGGTLTGNLTLQWGDLVLGTASTASNDSGDIVWTYGNGNEKARIWMPETVNSLVGPNYRLYNSSGSQIYNGSLVPLKTTSVNYTSYSLPTSQVSGGSITIYKFGRVATIKINGVTFKYHTSRITFLSGIPNAYCPYAQVCSESIGAGGNSDTTFYIIFNSDGTLQYQKGDTGNWTLYENFTYITAS